MEKKITNKQTTYVLFLIILVGAGLYYGLANNQYERYYIVSQSYLDSSCQYCREYGVNETRKESDIIEMTSFYVWRSDCVESHNCLLENLVSRIETTTDTKLINTYLDIATDEIVCINKSTLMGGIFE